MLDVFLSYCQKDNVYADDIDSYFKGKLKIHRDVRDIADWKSIREYMQSISKMDYAIIVITENYLKSFNCMYEVMELVKDHNYKNKVFPVIVENKIYALEEKVKYIKFLQDKSRELENKLQGINLVNIGNLTNELKIIQNIASSIGDFLSLIGDMNNPNILDVNKAIEHKLKDKIELDSKREFNHKEKTDVDLFEKLKIKHKVEEPTELEKNQFVKNGYKEIKKLMNQLCDQYQNKNNNTVIEIDEIDARATTYEFYINGKCIRSVKVFMANPFGGNLLSIGINDSPFSISNSSFNGIYSVKYENGIMGFDNTLSISNSIGIMNIEEVVADIWKNYIQIYLEQNRYF